MTKEDDMEKLIKIYRKHKEGIDYLFWGGITFLLSMVLFWAFTSDIVGIGWNEVFANNIDWVICVIFAFVVNKFFVFHSKAGNINGFFTEFAQFVTARIFTLLLEDGIIWLLCSVAGWQTGLLLIAAKFIGQFVVIVTNYILSKLWIFKDRTPKQVSPEQKEEK